MTEVLETKIIETQTESEPPISPPDSRIPFFLFARDICGWWYIDGSRMNYEMADFFEKGVHAWLDTRNELRKRVKLAFVVPRKGRKSTLITRSGPIYLLVHDHDLSILIDSEQKQRANDFLGSMQRIMDGTAPSAKFTEVMGGSWRDDQFQWREDRCVISERRMLQRGEPSLITSSVEIGYTGGAPDAIFIDDPMSPESHTDAWMASVRDHYDGYGPVLMPNGLFCKCLTRYDDADLCGHTQRIEGWHVCNAEEAEACIRAGKCVKATEQYPEPWHVFYRKALTADDYSADQVCWTTEFLHTERKKNPSFFMAQYMNDPWENPDASFQKEDFSYVDKVPADVVRILSTDIAWKASTQGTERSGDFNVFVLAEHQKSTGSVYITDVQRGRWTMGEWGDKLVGILRRARASRIPVSRMTYEELMAGAAGAIEVAVRAACQRWNELAPALVKAPRGRLKGAKIERIKAVAQYFQNHQVYFARPCKNTEYNHDCPQCASFQVLRDELLKLGVTLYDDAADAMADQFLPEIYSPAPVFFSHHADPPKPERPWDDMLKGPQEPTLDAQLYEVMDDLNKIDLNRWYPV